MADPKTKELKSKKRLQSDMLGVDLSDHTLKAVRLKKTKVGLVLAGASLLQRNPESSGELPRIPRELLAHHVSICYSGNESIIRLLSLPGAGKTKLSEHQLREQIGVNSEYRLAYSDVSTEVRGERKVVAVAIRDEKAREILSMFDQPTPAPVSLEVSGLAALTAFMASPQFSESKDAFGFIDSGSSVNMVAFFCRGQLVLLRKFDFGGDALVEKVSRHLGLERDVAMGLVNDGAFDLSEPVKDLVGPFFRQLSISKDFVERHQRTRLDRLYVTGGMSLSKYWMGEIARKMGVRVLSWEALNGLSIEGQLPSEISTMACRFSSSIGAALGAMQQR